MLRSKIYFYTVSWGWYETYAPKMFYSDQEYTQDGFEALIKRLSNTSALEIIDEKEPTWLGNDEIIECVWKKLLDIGFAELEYSARYSMWGSSIIDRDDKGYDKHLSPEVLEAVIRHNQNVEKGLHDSSEDTANSLKVGSKMEEPK